MLRHARLALPNATKGGRSYSVPFVSNAYPQRVTSTWGRQSPAAISKEIVQQRTAFHFIQPRHLPLHSFLAGEVFFPHFSIGLSMISSTSDCSSTEAT